jgi:hypothetical protein
MTLGFATMAESREYLVKKGMTEEFADQIARQYISKLENPLEGDRVRLMDFFDSKGDRSHATNVLMKA